MQANYSARKVVEVQWSFRFGFSIQGDYCFIPTAKSLQPRALGLETEFLFEQIDSGEGSVILLQVRADSQTDVGFGMSTQSAQEQGSRR